MVTVWMYYDRQQVSVAYLGVRGKDSSEVMPVRSVLFILVKESHHLLGCIIEPRDDTVFDSIVSHEVRNLHNSGSGRSCVSQRSTYRAYSSAAIHSPAHQLEQNSA